MSRLSFLGRNPRRRIGALAALTAAAAVAVGSGANFTAATANPSNTFAAGSLSMLNSKNNAAILTASNMKPGDTTTSTVDIKNTGTVSGVFSLAKSNISDSDGTNPLSQKLTVTISDCGLFSGGTPPSCASPTQKYSGTISAMGTIALGTFAADDNHRYQFTVTWTAGAGDDNYQGDSTSVEYDWSATS